MTESTFKDLVERVEALERAMGIRPGGSGAGAWRSVVGMFAGSDFMKRVDEEGRNLREAERSLAQQESSPE